MALGPHPAWILNALAQHKIPSDRAVVAVRGYLSSTAGPTPNQLGIYDDVFCRVLRGQVAYFRGSTDPGRYWVQHPANPQGCARLRAGVHFFEKGLHQGRPAFVQARAFQIDRIDATGAVRSRQVGYFGINNHSGGSNPDDVGRWSAGCQVVFDRDGGWGADWLAYYEPLAQTLRAGEEFPYLLVECPLAAFPAQIA